jgi:hypothetical protein
MDDPQGCVALGFCKKDQTCIAVLGPQDNPTDGTTPMLYASNLQKSREVLGSRGVNVGRGSEGRYACDLQRVALPPLQSLSRGPPRDPSNRGEQRRTEAMGTLPALRFHLQSPSGSSDMKSVARLEHVTALVAFHVSVSGGAIGCYGACVTC